MSETLTKTESTKNISYRRPAYSVASNDKEHNVRVEIPGCTKEDVQIQLENDLLSIQTHRGLGDEKRKIVHREYQASDYRLALTLNVKVDGEKISAKTEQGVLTITLPVAEEAKPRQIAVK